MIGALPIVTLFPLALFKMPESFPDGKRREDSTIGAD
jgi:hypothetical protein